MVSEIQSVGSQGSRNFGHEVLSSSTEADHRIANNLQFLSGYVRRRIAEFAQSHFDAGGDEFLIMMKGVCAQIDLLALQHRAFLTEQQSALTSLGERLHEILTPYRSGLSGIEVIEDFQPECKVQPQQCLRLMQIIAEAVNNAVKYASPTGKGIVHVRCYKGAREELHVEICDNGPGLPAGFDPATDGGVGFRLMRVLSRQLGASMDVRSDGDGTHFRLVLPAATLE